MEKNKSLFPKTTNLCIYTKNSVHFQGKPFNITVIQVYAPTSNSEEAEVEQFFFFFFNFFLNFILFLNFT